MARRALLVVLLVVGTSSLGVAGSCGTGSLASYIGTSCTIGSLTFSDFSYTGSGSGGAAPISSSGVTVIPSGLGFLFNAPWDVGPGQGLDSSITYTVTADAGDSITALLLAMEGFGFSGSGSVEVSGSTTIDGDPLSLLIFVDSAGLLSSESVDFTGVTSLTFTKDITVNGGNGIAGVAFVLSDLTSTPSITPEPASMLLLGSGLLGLAGYVRRRQRKLGAQSR